ncbi:hypothetical protein Tco_0618099 [Tanacetum coccineum]
MLMLMKAMLKMMCCTCFIDDDVVDDVVYLMMMKWTLSYCGRSMAVVITQISRWGMQRVSTPRHGQFPDSCVSSNLRIEDREDASLKERRLGQNGQRPLTIGFDYGDLVGMKSMQDQTCREREEVKRVVGQLSEGAVLRHFTDVIMSGGDGTDIEESMRSRRRVKFNGYSKPAGHWRSNGAYLAAFEGMNAAVQLVRRLESVGGVRLCRRGRLMRRRRSQQSSGDYSEDEEGDNEEVQDESEESD